MQQQAVSGVFEGREIKTEVFVEQRRVVFFCLPSGCCLHFLLKNLQRREGERGREKPNAELRRKRVQKNVTGIKSAGSVIYVCVHLCTSGVCEAFLLIGASGMGGIGLAEINAKTVCPPMKLSRTRIRLTRYQTTWKPESSRGCVLILSLLSF